MAAVRLLSAVKKAHGFDIRIETRPVLYAYRAAVVWTPDSWRNVEYAECKLVNTTEETDVWGTSISYDTAPETTFFYAVVAAAVDGTSWDNNDGQNYLV